jgi:hypothetical protein
MKSPQQGPPLSDDVIDTIEQTLAEGLAQIRTELSAQLTEHFESAIAEIRSEHEARRDHHPHHPPPPQIKVASEREGVLAAAPGADPPVRRDDPRPAPRDTYGRAPAVTPFSTILREAVRGRNVVFLLAIVAAIASIGVLIGWLLTAPRRSGATPTESSQPGSGGTSAGPGASSKGTGTEAPARGNDSSPIEDALRHIRASEASWLDDFAQRRRLPDVTGLQPVATAGVLDAIERYVARQPTPQDERRILYALLQNGLNRNRTIFTQLDVDGVMGVGSAGLPTGNTGQAFTDYLTAVYLPERNLKTGNVALAVLVKELGGPEAMVTLSRAVVHDQFR